jgi:hypothetical protein
MTLWVRTLLSRLALAITPLWLDPLAWWLAFSPVPAVSYLGMLLASLELLYAFVFLAALVAFVVCPIRLLFRKYRPGALSWLLCAVVFVPAFGVGLGLRAGICSSNVDRVIERGQPLADAITAYHAEHGHPPVTLDELVPKYIDRIPETGIGSLPNFSYWVVNPEEWHGNKWVLMFTPPNLPLGFRRYCYLPRRNYTEAGYGSLGDWGCSGD